MATKNRATAVRSQFRAAGLVALLMLAALPAAAQNPPPVVTPTRAEFTDLDFDAGDDVGQPVVTGYYLEIWTPGADTTGSTPPLQQSPFIPKNQTVQNTATNNPLARILPSTVWGIVITQGPTFVATIKSVGPGGTARSAVSNPFTFPLPSRVPRAVIGLTMAGGK